MPLPLKPHLTPVVSHGENAEVVGVVFDPGVGKYRLMVDAALVVAANVAIDGNTQVQTVEALPLLASLAVFDGTEHDNINHEAMAASLTLASTLGTTVTIRFQQRATGLATFRDADVISLAIPVGGALVNFDRVWSVTREFGRIEVDNTGANPLTVAELVVTQKPIS